MIETCLSVKEVTDDLDYALLTLSPRQAWAMETRDQIFKADRQLRRTLACALKNGTMETEDYVQRLAGAFEEARDSVMLAQTALANSGMSNDLYTRMEALSRVILKHMPGVRIGESFHHGAVTYAKVRLTTGGNQIVKIVGDDLHVMLDLQKDAHAA